MDFIQFTLPETLGETLAWLTALGLLLLGLFIMISPRAFANLTGLSAMRADGWAELRGPFGGMLAGFALACLMLSPQPLLYFALGLALTVAAIGRILAMLVDKAGTAFSFGALAMEALGAFFTLGYTFRLIV